MALIIVPVLIAIGVDRLALPRLQQEGPSTTPNGIIRRNWNWWCGPRPLLIIIALGAMTWIGTHQLDPYRPLTGSHPASRSPAECQAARGGRGVAASGNGCSSIRSTASPRSTSWLRRSNVPIQFKLTSDTMMDSFFVPALAGQIYTMPGMQTVLHAVINKPGTYRGLFGQLQRHGLHRHALPVPGHEPGRTSTVGWPRSAPAGGDLDARPIDNLRQPSRDEPVHYYARYDADLYHRILNRCVDPGQTCMSQMMAMDAACQRCRKAMRTMPSPRRPMHAHRPRTTRRRTDQFLSRFKPCLHRSAIWNFLFGRLSLDSLPLHNTIVVCTFVRGRRGSARGRARRHHWSSASGATCGASGSPAWTTRSWASCT